MKMNPNKKNPEERKKLCYFDKYLQEKNCCYQKSKKREAVAKKTSIGCCDRRKNKNSQNIQFGSLLTDCIKTVDDDDDDDNNNNNKKLKTFNIYLNVKETTTMR
jgi:hypothetical protein